VKKAASSVEKMVAQTVLKMVAMTAVMSDVMTVGRTAVTMACLMVAWLVD